MRFAIYSRKSRFTGKGESIENQVEMCNNYIKSHFQESDISEIKIYEDEGFSGKNTNRPQFQLMMKEEKKNHFDFIVVYRLDRISRNVGDFAKLIEELNAYKTSFICIKEQFDTSTPMGRAMMNIAAVFAQLERETIAERIKDNMHMLARSGRWLGGTAPAGYKSKQNESVDMGDGRKRTSYSLTIDDSYIDTVKLIFNKFLETESLTKLETYLLNNGILTIKGKQYTVSTLRNIFKNPVYCIADADSIQYYTEQGCDIYYSESDIDNKSGFTTYNKTQADAKRTKNELTHWIITIGTHEGIIDGKTWVKIQNILASNAHKGFRKVHNSTALLSGIIKCSCGAYMRPKYHRPNKNGERPFSYMCETKERSKSQLCSLGNVSGTFIDEYVCKLLLDFDIKDSIIEKQLAILRTHLDSNDNTLSNKSQVLKKTIADKETSIQSLMQILMKGVDDTTLKRIDKQIAETDHQINELSAELYEIEQAEKNMNAIHEDFKTIQSSLSFMKEHFNELSVNEKRNLIKACIQSIIWDGKEIHIFMYGVR